jgi:mRNA interferase YafQ
VRRLVPSAKFVRNSRKYLAKHPEHLEDIGLVMQKLALNPFQASLETHKLKGLFAGYWSCTVAYDLRIIFEFVKDPNETEDTIILIDVGKHDEVY